MDFTVEGDVRFLAHSDMLRLFARATARAGLPVHYSSGFNPHPQISLPLPRSVGMASVAERLVIGLDEPIAPQEACARLASEMPEGIRITRAWAMGPCDACLPLRAEYRVGLAPVAAGMPKDSAGLSGELSTQDGRAALGYAALPDVSEISERIGNLLRRSECRLQRLSPKHRGGKWVDILPHIERLEACAGSENWVVELRMTLRITPAGSAKPAEVCQALELNLDAFRHFIRRVEVEWQ
jgi:hypothetical protein